MSSHVDLKDITKQQARKLFDGITDRLSGLKISAQSPPVVKTTKNADISGANQYYRTSQGHQSSSSFASHHPPSLTPGSLPPTSQSRPQWTSHNGSSYAFTPPKITHTRQNSTPLKMPEPEVLPPLTNPLPRPPAIIDFPEGYVPYSIPLYPPPQLPHSSSAPPLSSLSSGYNTRDNQVVASHYSEENLIHSSGEPSSSGHHPIPEASFKTPTKARRRAESTPPSPTTPSAAGSDVNTTQCSGIAKTTGKRCTRLVKAPPPISFLAPEDQTPRFCYQHAGEILKVTGFHSRVTGIYVEFDNWIPEHLQPDTKVLLRSEMEKPISAADEDGYIYCFELRDPKTPHHVHLKVGRAVNLNKRIDQWTKSCESKEPILRGWFPGPDDEDLTQVSLLKGVVKAGKKGKHCHRLERLIHLELADLSLHNAHLKLGFQAGKPSSRPKKKKAGDDVLPTTPTKATPKKSGLQERKPCTDCGAVHKEIFTFKRFNDSELKNREWENVVHPVIERWGEFVERYM
ncbi:hypothetical protein FRC03_000069 [Tulasnella sp. 419]|nr:hypothetical protein FRC03_000069 [Tulasnella sp. 419]